MLLQIQYKVLQKEERERESERERERERERVTMTTHLLMSSVGSEPVGNFAVLRLCLTLTQMHQAKNTMAATNTRDRAIAIMTTYLVSRTAL